MSFILDTSDRREHNRSVKGRRGTDFTKTTKEPAQVIYRRYVISRIYVVLSILSTLIVFLTSDIYSFSVINENFGQALIWFLVAVCLFAISDICINDILPENYNFMFLYRNRHIIYMILAIGMYGITAAIILSNGQAPIMIRMWLDGFFATTVAVLDIFARHRGTSWQSGK